MARARKRFALLGFDWEEGCYTDPFSRYVDALRAGPAAWADAGKTGAVREFAPAAGKKPPLEALLRIAIVERNFVGGTAKERKESCLIRGESSVSMTQGVALALIW
jgi:hypothetical protein